MSDSQRHVKTHPLRHWFMNPQICASGLKSETISSFYKSSFLGSSDLLLSCFPGQTVEALLSFCENVLSCSGLTGVMFIWCSHDMVSYYTLWVCVFLCVHVLNVCVCAHVWGLVLRFPRALKTRISLYLSQSSWQTITVSWTGIRHLRLQSLFSEHNFIKAVISQEIKMYSSYTITMF